MLTPRGNQEIRCLAIRTRHLVQNRCLVRTRLMIKKMRRLSQLELWEHSVLALVLDRRLAVRRALLEPVDLQAPKPNRLLARLGLHPHQLLLALQEMPSVPLRALLVLRKALLVHLKALSAQQPVPLVQRRVPLGRPIPSVPRLSLQAHRLEARPTSRSRLVYFSSEAPSRRLESCQWPLVA